MTQGMIVIVDKETKEVLFKIIVGCGGDNIDEVVKWTKVKNINPEDLGSLYDLSRRNKFGCEACLVVMNKDHVVYEGGKLLDSRYRKTFENTKFNPRWSRGDCEYLEVLEYPYKE
jgi:hypothetical protein